MKENYVVANSKAAHSRHEVVELRAASGKVADRAFACLAKLADPFLRSRFIMLLDEPTDLLQIGLSQA